MRKVDPLFSYVHGSLDVMFMDDIDIKIRKDGRVLWINAPDCILRICRIAGTITIIDERQANDKVTDQNSPDGQRYNVGEERQEEGKLGGTEPPAQEANKGS